ncbi:MAG: chromate transporter [Pseudomonadota bacterium]
MVAPGWVREAEFLTGYAAAQAVPGPLFSLAAYLGTVSEPAPNGPLGAAIALVGVFLPGLLLVAGALPFWQTLREVPPARAILSGVNAAVVGVLASAFYDPVFTTAVSDRADAALALAGYFALTLWKVPVWTLVLAAAFAGTIRGGMGI